MCTWKAAAALDMGFYKIVEIHLLVKAKGNYFIEMSIFKTQIGTAQSVIRIHLVGATSISFKKMNRLEKNCGKISYDLVELLPALRMLVIPPRIQEIRMWGDKSRVGGGDHCSAIAQQTGLITSLHFVSSVTWVDNCVSRICWLGRLNLVNYLRMYSADLGVRRGSTRVSHKWLFTHNGGRATERGKCQSRHSCLRAGP